MIVTDSVTGRPAERDFSDCYIFPASSGQRRLWFLGQLEPESHAAYHVRAVIEIHGPLDLLAFQQAFNDVVACHESMRTGIALVDSEPSQVIVPEIAVAVPVIDCAGMSEQRQREELESVIRHEAVRRFELDAPPLVRLTLLRMSDRQHVLVVVMHHIICDGWSMAIFMAELAAAYRNARAGHGRPAEPPIQYADYTVWQAERLTGPRERALADHWRAKLTDLPVADLPADFPRPPVRSGRGAARHVRLSGDLLRNLDAVGERCGATRFMTLLAVFKLLLMRYTGQADVVVGTAVANRPMPELERLIGLFANTLVLRTGLGGDPTFTALLGRVRQTCLDAFEHQELPFEKVVEELRPARDVSRTPLFQFMFLMQNTPGAAVGDGELTFTPRAEGARTAKYDLTLVAEPDREGLQLWLEYSSDLFTAATADRMLRHLVTILRAVLDEPDAPVSRWVGKVDQAAPQTPADQTAPRTPVDRTPPRTPAEREVAAIFAEILEVGQVGSAADFFDLGGHSLLAAQLVARLEERTGVRIRLRDIFKRSTVAAIAEIVAERRDARAERDGEAVRAIVRALPDTELDAMLHRLTAGRCAAPETNHEGNDREV
jgi:acyl carrier protein